jgi:hypothetical protein
MSTISVKPSAPPARNCPCLVSGDLFRRADDLLVSAAITQAQLPHSQPLLDRQVEDAAPESD